MTDNPHIRNPHLPGDDFFWEGNQIGVLLIHGLTATTAEIRPLAENLHQAGYTVAGPLLPGHGTHPDDLNRATWGMWVEKVKQTYESLLAHCQRVFVGGQSTGALLSLELARQHPEIPGLLIFAPAIKINGIWRAHILWPFIKHYNKPNKPDDLLWKGYYVNPVKAVAELHKLQRHIQRNLPSVTQPLVVFTGEFDQTIAPDSAQILLKGVRSMDKRHINMPASGHLIILDKEIDRVTEFVLDFIQARS
ncbi:MAG: alpha/beta fold hydrolase [Brevefilum sp.]|nr:alpha/beta fold hydrolase [Brevefilum sp.]